MVRIYAMVLKVYYVIVEEKHVRNLAAVFCFVKKGEDVGFCNKLPSFLVQTMHQIHVM